ncbi:hypothetical protein LCGC14_0451140 [marine sediment metagenome]|uniref:Uncharacterized protein n=1 Tax=marine sediment metagenome TaxID=412755 RepID=A0A0F9VRT6_9ZZZZ
MKKTRTITLDIGRQWEVRSPNAGREVFWDLGSAKYAMKYLCEKLPDKGPYSIVRVVRTETLLTGKVGKGRKR